MKPVYSIVIPTLNEADALRRLLPRLGPLPSARHEVIVSDGGSGDDTCDVARRLGAMVTMGRRGRGFQMNRGARLACGDVLLFLHADSRLPSGWERQLDRHFVAAGLRAAAFRLRFRPRHPSLRFAEWWSSFDSVVTRYGDQGLVVSRKAFDLAGGYPDWPLMEDVEIGRRLRRFTAIPSLPMRLGSSSRRFLARGVWRQRAANARTMLRFLLLGVSPWRLAEDYDARRPKPDRDALILFARFPSAGKVKTRLAASIGADMAAEFYRRMAEGVVANAKAAGDALRTYVFVADAADGEAVKRWLGEGITVLEQEEGDLGARMADAFETVFSYGHARVLIAGTDVPSLTQGHFRRGLGALDACDVVLGPAVDGGYYLLGLKRPSPRLFSGMAWSQTDVLAQTLERARGCGWTVAQLDVLEDVDDAASLERSGLLGVRP